MRCLTLVHAYAVVLTLLCRAIATPVAQNKAVPTTEPCAQARDEAAAYVADHGSEEFSLIRASLAQACLRSIPFYSEPAFDLLNSLRAYVEVQSTIDYLQFPPEGYLYDAVNVSGELDVIEAKIAADGYDSEYDFQLDLYAASVMAKDGHFTFRGDVLSLFSWTRPGIALVSASLDGMSIPQIYNLDDLVVRTEVGMTPASLESVSQIVKINDLDVVRFIQAESYANTFQDPDAAWNTEFFSIPRAGKSSGQFGEPLFYPGETTILSYANGTVRTVKNLARVLVSLEDITSGSDMYQAFVSSTSSSPSSGCSDEPPNTKTLKVRQTSTNITQLPFYPVPVSIDPSGVVSGYFPQGQDLNDVAVLAISGFSPPSPSVVADDAWQDTFQMTIQTFLAAAGKSGRTKLIIDLQGNGGGIIDLALDTYMQLFPKSNGPNSRGNLRASFGMELIMQAAARNASDAEAQNATTEAITDRIVTPFAFQNAMSPDMKSFSDAKSYYGPHQNSRGVFTSDMQNNWTNAEASEVGLPGITITGTGDRTGYPQYFDAGNVVLLTDGYCASSCTIISELLKNNQQVKSFAMGGRPKLGPMQSSGGVKGSQLFNAQVIWGMTELLKLGSTEENVSVKGTVWENFTNTPILRSGGGVSVNGKNAYRIGDDTNTALQFVYEASDCRLFNDLLMISNPVAVWAKVATAAFSGNGTIDKSYCVPNSTGHPTSVSGGWVKGTIGPQEPPQGAKAVPGWLVDGATIVMGSGVGAFTG